MDFSVDGTGGSPPRQSQSQSRLMSASEDRDSRIYELIGVLVRRGWSAEEKAEYDHAVADRINAIRDAVRRRRRRVVS
jgi:hypothetical protein